MRVVFQKVDLDTCLTAIICGVKPGDLLAHCPGGAKKKDLSDRFVLCIEAGGSGQPHLNNFDHHNSKQYLPPACRQAADHHVLGNRELLRMVDYVCQVDEAMKILPPVAFPSLSNLFSGMMLVVKEPINQFRTGVKLLWLVHEKDFDPFCTMPALTDWEAYLTAKLQNQERLKMVIDLAEYYTSTSGIRIGYLEHDAIGGLGALYKQGCQVGMLYSAGFGVPPVRKFTIAGNCMGVGHLKPFFDDLEPGWGGTHTILGSPRDRSTRLSKEQVLSIVKEHI